MVTTDKKKEDLMKMTMRDLREMVVKLGMPEEDAENFEKKKPLIATINAFRALIAVKVPGQVKGDKENKEEYLSKKERMRAILMKQPKIRIKVPKESAEKVGDIRWIYNKITKRKEQVYFSGAYLPVQINGFKWLVAKGMYQDVPEQVADVIGESEKETMEAGKHFLIDRKDPETGESVRDRLE